MPEKWHGRAIEAMFAVSSGYYVGGQALTYNPGCRPSPGVKVLLKLLGSYY